MYLGRVLGRAVCTIKDPQLSGLKLLIVTRIDASGKAKGQPFIACDSIGAGNGETVFLCGGGEAAFPFIKKRPPSDASILGIIDNLEGK
ncbi:MAG: EutN/CcmL family microcompartment protein [Candidatus Riflebacteria bacterium]|nr:EutN/CcmL family microcompartment protein [Candidatus Riflebacteria bacterium]